MSSPLASLTAALAATTAITALAVVPAAALADGSVTAAVASVPTGAECALVGAPGSLQAPDLADRLGFRFGTGAFDAGSYATLVDGTHAESVAPYAPQHAYDRWGDLFVGATPSIATRYGHADELGCSREDGGREVAFATVTIGGLQVRRKILVSARTASGAASGARLVQSVTNPGPAPVTTNVYVGDLTTTLNKGRLGSGSATTVGPTSSGDAVLTSDDRWVVTSDADGGRPAIAHVWDGPGAATHASVARLGAQAGTAPIAGTGFLGRGQFGYGWEQIVIPAGGTASFLSWEALRVAADPAEKAGLAEDAAVAIDGASAATIFEGMDAGEIAAVRNWPKPSPSVAIRPVGLTSASAPVTLRATDPDFTGGSSLPQCATGALTWTFGDGATATGQTVTHRFAAGAASATLTATSACGGRSTSRLQFAVQPAPTEAPVAVEIESAPETPTGPVSPPVPSASPTTDPLPVVGPGQATPPAGTGAPLLTLVAPDRLPVGLMGKKGIGTEIVSTVPGKLRIVLSGGGLKLAKNMTLTPGVPRTPTFRLSPRDLAVARRAPKLQVRAKLTLASGAEVIVSRFVVVKR